MNHFFKYLTFLFVLLLFGCGPDYILDQKYDIEKSEWTYADTLNFEVDIQDSLKIYNIHLKIEHSTEFPKQNMYIMIHTQFPSGERISEKLSVELANLGGGWYGDCNSEWCQFSLPIQEGAFFNAIGKHTFTLEQYMRIDPVPGIKNISLKIEDTGKSRG